MKRTLFLLITCSLIAVSVHAQNLIINGDFEDGPTLEPWWVFVDITQAEVSVDSSEGSVNYYEITTPGSNTYDIQLIQNLSEDQIAELADNIDSTYYLTFDAIVPEERNCNLFLGQVGGEWANLASGVTFTFVPETTVYGIGILITEVFDEMKFGLEIGTSSVPVEFDNILLSKEFPEALAIEQTNTNAYSIYPNPAYDVVHVKTDIGSVVNLYSLTGILLDTKIVINESVVFDLKDLAAGIYFISIEYNNTKAVSKLFIR
ncbi:MAG: T9SS type A sorting domain-containing protein [Bacteroidales bacterium]|nr:T9SS type A sorting domain-containing protein [Bacteroidales bacterium]